MRKFTKSFIFRDFDDVLRDPFRYVHLFLLVHYYQNYFSKIAMHDLYQMVQCCGAAAPSPPLNEGVSLIKCRF